MNKLFKHAVYSLSALALVFGSIYYFSPSKSLQVEASVQGYSSVEQLASSAELILIGTPEKNFSDYTPYIKYTDHGTLEDFHTVTNFHVQKVLKGNINGDTIPILEGAVLMNQPMKYQKELVTIEGYQPLEKGKKYLLFLKVNDVGSFGTLGVYNGKFNVDNSDANEKTYTEANKEYKKLKEGVLSKYKDKF